MKKEKDPNDPGFLKYLSETALCKKCGREKWGNGTIGLYYKDGKRARNAWLWKNPVLWTQVTAMCAQCASEAQPETPATEVKGPSSGLDPEHWLFMTLVEVRKQYSTAKGISTPISFQDMVEAYQAYIKKLNEIG